MNKNQIFINYLPVFITLLYFSLSIIFYLLNIKGFYEVLPSTLYLILVILNFVIFAYKKSLLNIFPWFFFSSGIFIGFGTLGSYIRYEDRLDFLSRFTSISFINLLNSLSILIVVLFFIFFLKKITLNKTDLLLNLNRLVRFQRGFIIFLFLCLFANYYFYLENTPSQFLLSILSKITIIETGLIFIVSLLFHRMSSALKFIFLFYIILNTLFLLTFFSKFLIIKLCLVIMIGFWIVSERKNTLGVFFSLLLVSIYFILNPLVNFSRTHNKYIENKTDLISKFVILKDSFHMSLSSDDDLKLINKFKKNFISGQFESRFFKKEFTDEFKEIITNMRQTPSEEFDFDKMLNKFNKNLNRDLAVSLDHIERTTKFKNNEFNLNHRLINFLHRLDVVSVQRFIAKQYLIGNNGETLNNFWYILIPRVVWKEKPIMTNQAVKLNSLLFETDNSNWYFKTKSSVGPSMHMEGFWNYGIFGLIFVSIGIGIVFVLFDFFSTFLLNTKYFFSFLLIFPTLLQISLFYESWMISFFGQFISTMGIFFVCISIIFTFSKVKFFSWNNL